MKQIEIGTAVIQYDENGAPLTGTFTTAINVTATDNEIGQLLKVQGVNQDEIKRNAELLMAAWFLKVDKVELTDRTQGAITSEVISCLKWANGLPKKVEIKFTYKPLVNPQSN